MGDAQLLGNQLVVVEHQRPACAGQVVELAGGDGRFDALLDEAIEEKH